MSVSSGGHLLADILGGGVPEEEKKEKETNDEKEKRKNTYSAWDEAGPVALPTGRYPVVEAAGANLPASILGLWLKRKKKKKK